VSDNTLAPIRVPILLWRALILELRNRSAGYRESGAFLLGQSQARARAVTGYVCYDDLDPDAYQNGMIAFHAVGHPALWRYCREHKLQVMADIHNHPTGVQQSPTDQQNPMLPVVGHTALIVPNFARTQWWSLHAIGVYEYLGDRLWRRHTTGGKSPRVALTIW
jgi:hypothetical protein